MPTTHLCPFRTMLRPTPHDDNDLRDPGLIVPPSARVSSFRIRLGELAEYPKRALHSTADGMSSFLTPKRPQWALRAWQLVKPLCAPAVLIAIVVKLCEWLAVDYLDQNALDHAVQSWPWTAPVVHVYELLRDAFYVVPPVWVALLSILETLLHGREAAAEPPRSIFSMVVRGAAIATLAIVMWAVLGLIYNW